MKHIILFFAAALAASLTATAQSVPADSVITGVWKGTSTCQVKSSPCHDETVVYRISRGDGPDTFAMIGYKIVDGAELEMGTVACQLDRVNNRLVSHDANSTWTFTLKGKTMEGTLILRNELYRKVKVVRQ